MPRSTTTKTPRPARAPPRAQRLKSAATRAALMAAARQRFGEVGYHATGTGDLVELASLTRGALYHHFQDKEALFAAVAIEVAEEIAVEADETNRKLPGSTWDKLMGACVNYLEMAAVNGALQRILMIDGPAVLGWQRWRNVQTAVIMPRLVLALNMAIDQGELRRRDPEPIARLFLAAVNDSALTIAHAENPQAIRATITEALMELLGGLRLRKV